MAKGKKTGGGSRKGIPNRVPSDLRQMILGALDRAGGVEYLERQAFENPAAFISLLGRSMPKEHVTGTGGFHITVTTGVPPCDADRGDAVRANKD